MPERVSFIHPTLRHPFTVAFLWFLLGGCLLSYSPAAAPFRWVLEAAFLCSPAILAWVYRSRHNAFSPPSPPMDSLPVFGLPAWMILIALGCLLRFYRLDELAGQLSSDEGGIIYSSACLTREWNWKFFRYIADLMPLNVWLAATWFKLTEPSSHAYRFLEALLSALSLPAAWFLARQTLPHRAAFAWMALWVSGAWALLIGRIGDLHGTELLLQLILMALGARSLDRVGTPTRWTPVMIGSILALGIYSYTGWIPIAATFLVAFWILSREDPRRRALLKPILWTTMILLLPFLVAAIRERYGAYVLQLASLGPSGNSVSGRGIPRALNAWQYIETVFWGARVQNDLGPVWGGLLNPLEGALFLLGITRIFSLKRSPRTDAFWIALGMLFLPGVLSTSLSFLRLTGAYPLFLFVALFGLDALLSSAAPALRKGIFLALLSISCALNAYHLMAPFHQAWGMPQSDRWYGVKSIPLERTYRVLATLASERGPGYVFTEWLPQTQDQSLKAMIYRFDATQNPHLSLGLRPWIGVLVPPEDRPFLDATFQGIEWHPLPAPFPFTLGILPLNAPALGCLGRWREAEADFWKVTRVEVERRIGEGNDEILRKLSAMYPSVKGDRFLERVYWERVGEYFRRMFLEEAYQECLDNASRRGYDTPRLQRLKGQSLMRQGKRAESEECFRQADLPRPTVAKDRPSR